MRRRRIRMRDFAVGDAVTTLVLSVDTPSIVSRYGLDNTRFAQ